MSRKDPSFAQLTSYMQDAEKSSREYDLHYNCLSRDKRHIAGEFYANSQHLKKHKARNTLYHEIISISLEEGVDKKYAKDSLREIADKWVEMRCPNNMVYGCLHDDHENHLHYHLMISANELGQSNRFSLSIPEFQQIKHDHEAYVLQQYPELKQRAINTLSQRERSQSRKATAQQRRTGKLEQRELVRDKVVQSMLNTNYLAEFHENLSGHNMTYYQRGKNHGVVETQADGSEKKYRFSTIGVHESYEEYASVMKAMQNAQEAPEHAEPNEPFATQDKEENTSHTQEAENSTFNDDFLSKRQELRESQQKKHHFTDANIFDDTPQKEKGDRQNIKDNKKTKHEGFEEPFEPSNAQHQNDLRTSKRKQTQKPDQKFANDSFEGEKEKTHKQEKSAKSTQKPSQKKKPQKRKQDMKMKDVLGLRETYKNKSKPKPASKVDVEAQAQRAKQEAIDKLQSEFEKQTKKQSQNQSQSQGQKK